MNGHDHQSWRPYGGLRRRLVVVLVMLLCPVLIVTTPNVASAATVVQSAGVEWDIGGLSIGGFGSLECDATVTTTTYLDRADIQVGGIDCYGGPDASPGFSQPGEPGSSFVVWLTGTNCGGSAGGVFDAGSEDSAWRVHGSYGGAGWTAGPPTCDPATLCLKVDGAGSIRQGCSPLDLAPATATANEAACGFASFGAPGVSDPIVVGSATKRYQRRAFIPVLTQELGPTSWRAYLVLKTSGGGYIYGGPSYWLATTMPGATPFYTPYRNTSSTSGSFSPPPEDYTVIGVGIVRVPDMQNQTSGLDYLPQNQPSYGIVGVTDPSRCQFYWGEKIADTADARDEPFGTLGAPPAVGVTPPYEPPAATQEEGCAGFSWTDPASWTGAASCMMVAFLQRLISVMGQLLVAVGNIAAAILGGLADLFTPSPDSWGLEGLRTQWDNRGPGQVVGEVGDGLTSAADGYKAGGGCGSLADFSNDDISAHVTCASIRDQPGMAALYGLVQAGLIALTCWGIWHIVVGSIKARE